LAYCNVVIKNNPIHQKIKMTHMIRRSICRSAESFVIVFILTALILPFAWSFVPNPLCQSLHRYQLSSLPILSESSTTFDYLHSLSLQVEESHPALITADGYENENNASDLPRPPQLLSCEPMKWDGKQISENAYCLDLPTKLLKELVAYANHMGITDMYRGLVVDGRPLLPREEKTVALQGYNWMVQRPSSHWASNMHWVSPADETAHDDYLRVLSAGGFDQVLERVGTYFDLDSLSAYHLSFIGVSHCEKGFIHADVNDSGRKAFNMIIPLILQEEEGPELEILSDDETTTEYYKYKYNVASMVGDNALHATASCNYHTKGAMRMAATVYIGDITPDNVNHLLLSLTQAYPPVGNAQHLLDRAGSHWSKSDPSKKLPVSI